MGLSRLRQRPFQPSVVGALPLAFARQQRTYPFQLFGGGIPPPLVAPAFGKRHLPPQGFQAFLIGLTHGVDVGLQPVPCSRGLHLHDALRKMADAPLLSLVMPLGMEHVEDRRHKPWPAVSSCQLCGIGGKESDFPTPCLRSGDFHYQHPEHLTLTGVGCHRRAALHLLPHPRRCYLAQRMRSVVEGEGETPGEVGGCRPDNVGGEGMEPGGMGHGHVRGECGVWGEEKAGARRRGGMGCSIN